MLKDGWHHLDGNMVTTKDPLRILQAPRDSHKKFRDIETLAALLRARSRMAGPAFETLRFADASQNIGRNSKFNHFMCCENMILLCSRWMTGHLDISQVLRVFS